MRVNISYLISLVVAATISAASYASELTGAQSYYGAIDAVVSGFSIR